MTTTMIIALVILGVIITAWLAFVLWNWQRVECLWSLATCQDEAANFESASMEARLLLESVAKESLSPSVARTWLVYQDVLLNKILVFVAATQLVVERRLTNRVSLLTELFAPFWVSLTKKELPEKFVVQYLAIEEPILDKDNEIETAQKTFIEELNARVEKIGSTLPTVGKLQVEGSSLTRSTRRQEMFPALQRTRFWTAILVPVLMFALIVLAVAVMATVGLIGR